MEKQHLDPSYATTGNQTPPGDAGGTGAARTALCITPRVQNHNASPLSIPVPALGTAAPHLGASSEGLGARPWLALRCPMRSQHGGSGAVCVWVPCRDAHPRPAALRADTPRPQPRQRARPAAPGGAGESPSAPPAAPAETPRGCGRSWGSPVPLLPVMGDPGPAPRHDSKQSRQGQRGAARGKLRPHRRGRHRDAPQGPAAHLELPELLLQLPPLAEAPLQLVPHGAGPRHLPGPPARARRPHPPGPRAACAADVIARGHGRGPAAARATRRPAPTPSLRPASGEGTVR